jgi:lycopene cyclase domain-containing protein
VTGLYLGGLVVSIAGLVVLDLRVKLFLAAAPRRAVAVLATGVVGFLLWDAAGVGLGIFFEGPTSLLVGIDLAPRIPLEELFFLLLLSLSAMEAFVLAQRILDRRSPAARTDVR